MTSIYTRWLASNPLAKLRSYSVEAASIPHSRGPTEDWLQDVAWIRKNFVTMIDRDHFRDTFIYSKWTATSALEELAAAGSPYLLNQMSALYDTQPYQVYSPRSHLITDLHLGLAHAVPMMEKWIKYLKSQSKDYEDLEDLAVNIFRSRSKNTLTLIRQLEGVNDEWDEWIRERDDFLERADRILGIFESQEYYFRSRAWFTRHPQQMLMEPLRKASALLTESRGPEFEAFYRAGISFDETMEILDNLDWIQQPNVDGFAVYQKLRALESHLRGVVKAKDLIWHDEALTMLARAGMQELAILWLKPLPVTPEHSDPLHLSLKYIDRLMLECSLGVDSAFEEIEGFIQTGAQSRGLYRLDGEQDLNVICEDLSNCYDPRAKILLQIVGKIRAWGIDTARHIEKWQKNKELSEQYLGSYISFYNGGW